MAIALALMCMLPLAACSSSSSGLVSEKDSPYFASFIAERQSITTATKQIETTIDDRTVGLAVHHTTLSRLAHAGPPDHESPSITTDTQTHTPPPQRVIAMVHGVFSDHRTFRFIEPELANAGDLYLIDFPACGDSEIPTGTRFKNEDASTDVLAERVLQALRASLPPSADGLASSPPRVTLLGHSLGGAVVLRMMCNPDLRAAYADVLDRVDTLVLISAVDIAVPTPPQSVVRFLQTPDWMFGLGSATGYIASEIERETLVQAGSPDMALAEEVQIRRQYIEQPDRRRMMRAMFLYASPLTPDRRTDWEVAAYREADYHRLNDRGPVPTLLIYGTYDEITPLATGYKLDAQLPDSTLITMPGLKHSPHIEKPRETARAILDFLREQTDAPAGR